MTDTRSDIVCNCNEVSQESIVQAIESFDLKSIEEVSKATLASTNCGRCKPAVRFLLKKHAK